MEFYRLSPADWPDFRAAVREALTDGPLTVAELGQALTSHRAYRHLQPIFDEGAGTLIKPLTWHGDMSLGRPRDGQLTLQRLDDNPQWSGVPDLDQAGPRAVAAYFASYGPAPLDNLHHWLGDGLSAGRKRLQVWLGELGDRLVPVEVEGTETYVLREHVDSLVATGASEAVGLIPGHDQWVMGPGTRDIHVTPPGRRGLMTRKANPVILGGVVCGTWTRTGDDLTVTWLEDRPRPDRAIRLEAGRLGEFLGRDLRLVLRSWSVLHLIHGDVRATHQCIEIKLVGSGIESQPHARGDTKLQSGVEQRFGDDLADPRGHAAGGLLIVQLLEQHHELVAAPPDHCVVGPHGGGDARRHLLKDTVPCCVGVEVVDRLEVVQIDEDQRQGAALSGARGRGVLKPLHQHRPVAHAGERVLPGEQSGAPLGVFGPRAKRGVLDRERCGHRERFESSTTRVVGAAPVMGQIHREDAELRPVLRGQGREQRVLGVPGVVGVDHVDVGHPAQ